jgi:hypothetical protein
MTTIAWDGIALAGDKLRTIDGIPVPATKVFRVQEGGQGFLYGCAGRSGDCVAFQRWKQGAGEQPNLTDIYLICVKEDRSVWWADERLQWIEVPGGRWAIGSGGMCALGAMAAGVSARRAVEIATQHDNATGLGVDVVVFPA